MPGRRSDADVIAAQKEVLAHIRRGAGNRREAARRAGENFRTVEKWWDKDILGWRKTVLGAEGKRDRRAVENRKDVPDLETFRQECFGHDTPAHMREWFDQLLEPGFQEPRDHVRIVILQPPESGKTTAMEEFCVWAICRNPDIKIRYVCVSRDKAKERLYRIRELLSQPEAYEGRRDAIAEWGPFDPKTSLSTKSNPWSGEQLYVAGRTAGMQRDPTVQALGIGSAIQGARCDIIICDDIADDRNQRYPGERQKQLQWFAQQVYSRLPPLGGVLVIIGTRVQPDDIYAELLAGDTYDVLAQPAIIDEDAGLTLWPEHWSLEALQQRRQEVAELGEAFWYLTYQQQTVGIPEAPFQYDALQACKDMSKQVGQREPGWFVSVGVDPAQKGTMALVVTGLDRQNGSRHLIDCVAQKGVRDIEEARQIMLGAVKTYKANVLVIEEASQQGYFYNDRTLLSEAANLGCHVRAERTQSEKYDRDWGVYSVAALFNVAVQNASVIRRYHIPWLGADSQTVMRPLVDELASWRPSPGQRARTKTDRAMALWLAELGLRRMEKMGTGGQRVNHAPKWLRKRTQPPEYLVGKARVG